MRSLYWRHVLANDCKNGNYYEKRGGGEAPPATSPKSASVSSVSNITTSFAFFNAAKTPDKIQGSGPDWYEIAPLNKNSDSALW